MCRCFTEKKKKKTKSKQTMVIKIEGPDKIVTIGETLIVKRKYNRGRVLHQQWLFGGIERNSEE